MSYKMMLQDFAMHNSGATGPIVLISTMLVCFVLCKVRGWGKVKVGFSSHHGDHKHVIFCRSLCLIY